MCGQAALPAHVRIQKAHHSLIVSEAPNMSKPIYEERPELFEGMDCIDTPYRDPRQSPGYERLPDHIKAALERRAQTQKDQSGPAPEKTAEPA